MPEFEMFRKIPRLYREIVVTEKIDGTNAQIVVPEDPSQPLIFGSRNRWVTPGKTTDNYDFARWGTENMEALRRLGPGRHYGEWWGVGIARRYNLGERRFHLFNATQWAGKLPEGLPANVGVVPVLYQGHFMEEAIQACIQRLEASGSVGAPGFMKPEGIVVYHLAAGQYFKFTLDGDALNARKAPSPEMV